MVEEYRIGHLANDMLDVIGFNVVDVSYALPQIFFLVVLMIFLYVGFKLWKGR